MRSKTKASRVPSALLRLGTEGVTPICRVCNCVGQGPFILLRYPQRKTHKEGGGNPRFEESIAYFAPNVQHFSSPVFDKEVCGGEKRAKMPQKRGCNCNFDCHSEGFVLEYSIYTKMENYRYLYRSTVLNKEQIRRTDYE